MGKTYRSQESRYDSDDQYQKSRKGKHSGHSNNRKTGGMRVINDGSQYDYEDDDFFDDDVNIHDSISINIMSDTSR